MSASEENGQTPPERKSGERILSRWSRLKQEAKTQPPGTQAAAATDPKAPIPELPAVDRLSIDSDFRGFFHPKVDENLRHAALKKLFSDPHFNVMDGLDVYIDDYSKSDPLPAAMLAQLRQARKINEWAKERKEDAGTMAAATPLESASPLESALPERAEQTALPAAERPESAVSQAIAEPVDAAEENASAAPSGRTA